MYNIYGNLKFHPKKSSNTISSIFKLSPSDAFITFTKNRDVSPVCCPEIAVELVFQIGHDSDSPVRTYFVLEVSARLTYPGLYHPINQVNKSASSHFTNLRVDF